MPLPNEPYVNSPEPTDPVPDDDGPLNGGFEYRGRVGAAEASQPLIEYLAQRYRHSNATEWSSRLASGQVLLDGMHPDAGTILRPGQSLRVDAYGNLLIGKIAEE